MIRECSKCKQKFIIRECKTWWDYGGFDYDTKLIECPMCGCINILGYYEYSDRDGWFYQYGRRRTHGKKEIGKYLPKDQEREDGIPGVQVVGGETGKLSEE